MLNLERIIALSKADINNVTTFENVIKLSEEAGEVSSEYLKLLKAGNASKSAEGTRESVLEECFDTINVAMSLIVRLGTGFSQEQLADMAERKLDKWESKIP